MKRATIIVLCLFLLSLCVSCISIQDAEETDITEVTEEGKPVWTVEIPKSSRFLYGVGSANMTTASNSETAAATKASAGLARQIRQTINEATAIYTNEAGGQVIEATETITIRTVELTMSGVKTEQKWTASDGTVWVLISLPFENIPVAFENEARDYKSELEARKAEIEAQRAIALAVTDIPETYSLEQWQKEVNEYADARINALDGVSGSIDAEALRDSLKQMFTEKGYEL